MRKLRHAGDNLRDRDAPVWPQAQALYDALPAARKDDVVPPLELRRALGRAVLSLNQGDRAPRGYVTLAINPRASRQAIDHQIGDALDESIELRRRQRYNADEIKKFVLWYYQLAADPDQLKVLAIDEASRRKRVRKTTRARRGSNDRAINQAKSRINAGRQWLLKQLLPR